MIWLWVLTAIPLALLVGGPPPNRWSWRHRDPPWVRDRRNSDPSDEA